jgi:dTMP kinase
VFVAIEGIDGSGKATQVHLLHQRCLQEGLTCTKIAFPQYGRTPFAEAISEYLNGQFGGVRDVHPKLISVLYASDRYAAKDSLYRSIRESSIVISDRYVASNLAHQAAKLEEEERDSFIDWLSSIEYGIFDLPQADLTLYLDMPLRQANKLVHKKAVRQDHLFSAEEQGGYTMLKEDIHEADQAYLASCRRVYDRLREKQVGGRWVSVSCLDDGEQVRPAHEISQEIWGIVTAELAHKASLEAGQ